ncbi:MAG: phosphoribosylglycinamide formyltransferase [Gammaproteobacteria bacterium]|nr:phosphoribosylglycinamide formyltransferase [Gammaproteobacteria bacterium]
MSAPRRLPTVILISGRGSNLHAILRAVAGQALPIAIRAVISNRPDAPGLTLARDAGIPAEILDHTAFPDRQGFDDALQALIDSHAPELVVLAGFMRILSPSFVSHYHGRMLNIHPSLLPAFTGLDTHRRALEAGVREHGASVHFVTHALDGGPVVLEARVPVLPGDTAATLGARVLEAEHRIYPQAIRWFAEGRLRLAGNAGNEYALLDGKSITPELVAHSEGH